MIIVDSCGWIEYLADGPKASAYEKYLTRTHEIITPTIVVYEVYKKIKQTKKEEDALIVYGQIVKTRIVDITRELAVKAADLSLAYSLPMADAIVYATAKQERCKVVTSDPHFKELPGVILL